MITASMILSAKVRNASGEPVGSTRPCLSYTALWTTAEALHPTIVLTHPNALCSLPKAGRYCTPKFEK